MDGRKRSASDYLKQNRSLSEGCQVAHSWAGVAGRRGRIKHGNDLGREVVGPFQLKQAESYPPSPLPPQPVSKSWVEGSMGQTQAIHFHRAPGSGEMEETKLPSATVRQGPP